MTAYLPVGVNNGFTTDVLVLCAVVVPCSKVYAWCSCGECNVVRRILFKHRFTVALLSAMCCCGLLLLCVVLAASPVWPPPIFAPLN